MKKFFVISHTHWDREWYMTFEQFRMRLVDLMDRLFVILDENPDYIFNLDSQTIVLEDYLEIRPRMKDRLKKYIEKGQIITGPWYMQNDFNLTSGESTIRNLQRGIKMANEYGACQKVGYTPDQFGHISQIPQILNQFGIDNIVFGRGYKEWFINEQGRPEINQKPTEFILKGPDGSECLAIYMKEWYNNGQRFSEDMEKVKTLLDINVERFEGLNVTPYILMMNGVDHLEAQSNILQIIEVIKTYGYDIEQTSLETYLNEVKKYIKDNKVPLYTYDQTLNKGDDYSLLRGCWSSRITQKRLNVIAQDTLEHKIEPLVTTMEMMGFKNIYDHDYIDFMWKNLLKCHPHDSICGCSKDEVHDHLENRYHELSEITESYINKVMAVASTHLLETSLDNYTLTLFNGNDIELSQIIKAKIEFIEKENVKSFKIVNSKNENIPYIIKSHRKDVKDVVSPVNLPGVLSVDVYDILLKTDVIAPFSFDQYIIIPHEETNLIVEDEISGFIENNRYKVLVENQKVVLMDKLNHVKLDDFIVFENEVDRGDSYVFEPTTDQKFKSKVIGVSVVNNNDLLKELKLQFELEGYDSYDFSQLKPSEEIVKTYIDVLIKMTNNDVVDVSYRFVNDSKDHRVRLIVNTGIMTEGLYCDSAFDMMYFKKEDSSVVSKSKTFVNATVVAKRTSNKVSAVYTVGQHEAEELENNVALTILRSTGYIARVENFVPSAGELFASPGNQQLREISGRIGIEMTSNLTDAMIIRKARAFRNGLISYFNSADKKKFLGGRFAVQASSIAELFYLPDPYVQKRLSLEPVVKLNHDMIVTSALNLNDENEAMIRMYNISNENQQTKLEVNGQLFEVSLLGDTIKEVSSLIEFGPKEIKTIKVKYEV